jgi:transcriptional regulator with XRE-family HTH domain
MQSVLRRLGARLKQLREEQGFRMAEVAGSLGVEPTTLYAIERGDSAPSFKLFMELARLYKADEADLCTWPGSHLRHDLRELIRLTPNAKLRELQAAWAQVTGEDPAAAQAAPGGRSARR